MVQTSNADRKSPGKLSDSKSKDGKGKVQLENIGMINQPYVLKNQNKKDWKSRSKGESRESEEEAPKTEEHIFRLEFDPSSGIPPSWVDTKTLNFFNSLRDNIFALSSHYDRIVPANTS